MLKKYKGKDEMYVQGIRTWKELAAVVMEAKKQGYSYMGCDNVKGIGFAAVFKKQTERQNMAKIKKSP